MKKITTLMLIFIALTAYTQAVGVNDKAMVSDIYNSIHSINGKLSVSDSLVIPGFKLRTHSSVTNVRLGVSSGTVLTSGLENVLCGYLAGNALMTGHGNVFIGNKAGFLATGHANTYIGDQAGQQTSNGYYNVYVGYQSGYLGTTANTNIFMGYQAGRANTTGSGNVYLGNQAGKTAPATQSNKLIIANSETNNLITGDFSTPQVTINGDFNVDSARVTLAKMLFSDETPVAPVLGGDDTWTRFGTVNAMTVQEFGNIDKTSKSIVITDEGYYDVNVSASIGCDQATAQIHFGIAKNNTVMTYAQAEYTSKDAGDVHSVTIPSMPYLVAGDSLYCMIKSDSQGDSLRVKHLNFIIKNWY